MLSTREALSVHIDEGTAIHGAYAQDQLNESLCAAAHRQDLEKASALLARGADINCDDNSIAETAIAKNSLHVLQWAVDNGACKKNLRAILTEEPGFIKSDEIRKYIESL